MGKRQSNSRGPQGPEELKVPPVFPAWLRRRRPELQAEFENPFFVAFRRLECSRRARKGWWARQAVPSAQQPQEQFDSRFLIFILLMIGSVFTCGLLYPLVKKYTRALMAPKKSSLPTIPTSIWTIFGQTAYLEQPAIELWLTGRSPIELFDAVYLQGLRPWWGSYTVVAVFASVLISFLGITIWNANEPHPIWAPVFIVLELLVLIDLFRSMHAPRLLSSLRRNSLINLGTSLLMASETVMPEEYQEKPRRTLRERLLGIVEDILQFFIVIVVIGLLILAFLGVLRAIRWFLGSVIGAVPFGEGWIPPLRDIVSWGVVVALVLFLGLLALFRRQPSQEKDREADERAEARAMYAFNLYMSLVVLGDRDGVPWVRQTFARGWDVVQEDKKKAKNVKLKFVKLKSKSTDTSKASR